MTERKALLLARMDPPAENEADWNNWYNGTHVAARVRIPGFLSARRFTKIDGLPKEYATTGEAKYLALYDLTDIKVLLDKDYSEIREKEFALPPESYENQIFKLPKFTRAIYQQIYPEEGDHEIPPVRYAFVVGHEVPRNRHQEFNAWYNTEHIPALLSVPGFVSVRRFILNRREIPPITDKGGSASRYLTIWDLENEEALVREEFVRASKSPWTDWVRSWYTRKLCTLYEQIYPEI